MCSKNFENRLTKQSLGEIIIWIGNLHRGKGDNQIYILNSDVCVYSGLTSLSTIFQSYHDGVWLRQGAKCSLL